MERLPINKMDTRLRNLSPWRKQGREGGKIKGNLGWMKRTPLRKLRLNLADIENERIRLKRNTPVEKDCHDNVDYHEGLVLPWNTRTPLIKGMESTFDFEATRIPQLKTKQRIGLRNKPEQTYDRDFVRSFRGGAYTGSIVQHHHVQGSAHDIRSVPESA